MEVGIDITSIKRFENRDDRFIKNILTEVEYSIYNKLPIEKKNIYVAKRWACKEAIFKVTNDPKYLEYSILEDIKPYVLNHPEMKLSIACENDKVIAIVIVE